MPIQFKFSSIIEKSCRIWRVQNPWLYFLDFSIKDTVNPCVFFSVLNSCILFSQLDLLLSNLSHQKYHSIDIVILIFYLCFTIYIYFLYLLCYEVFSILAKLLTRHGDLVARNPCSMNSSSSLFKTLCQVTGLFDHKCLHYNLCLFIIKIFLYICQRQLSCFIYAALSFQ